MSAQPTPGAQYNQAIVKQVISGDTVVLRSVTSQGPPKERTLTLSGIVAPKLARRPNQNNEGGTKDEPFAWEAREFLRQLLVGKKVLFTVDVSTEKREYGTIYWGAVTENISESLVSDGLVDVRRTGIKSNEAHQRLCELEDTAKANLRGKHGPHSSKYVRDIKWNIDNKSEFVESWNDKPVKCIVEHVRDGSTLRILLLPDAAHPEYYPITFNLSGIKCPTFREDDTEIFAREAKFFTECRLLQRDVEVILEANSNNTFCGTVIHPNGNIAELLLVEGLAKCVDWTIQCVTGGHEKLRAAEKAAKEKRLRVWRDYTPSGPIIDAKEKEFQGKVVEVVNADAMMVKVGDGPPKKIFLASIRPPSSLYTRIPDSPDGGKTRSRPLYDIPYMLEAREFLRKKLIGKKVNVIVDYKQPANNNFPEKLCCTVTIGDQNVAAALVSKGLATVLKHRIDDDQRSAHYDELIGVETKAIYGGKGVHSKKETPVHRVVDLSGDLQKSKQFFPFLQRAGRMEAVVEFVASGSRLRLFVPRENCLLTFLLGGINCVRASRETKTGTQPGDAYGDEALAFTKDLCLQREVQVEVESMDKAGNFIGWLWIDNINLSEALVKEGFADIHATAARSPFYRQLQNAEEEAKKKKLRMWENQVPAEVETTKVEDTSERSVNYSKVMVTEVTANLTFCTQNVDEGPKLEELMQKLRLEFSNNPPIIGAYTPKKGDLCAARFSDDGLWYRARIDKMQGMFISVTYVDFGNKEVTTGENVVGLPSAYQALPPCAHEYALAFIKPPSDIEAVSEARNEFFEMVDNRVLLLNVEYKSGPVTHVTLLSSDETEDIGKELVLKGLVFVDHKKEKKFQKVVNDYITAQETAKKSRLNLWQYGDVTEDDAKEFG